MDSYFYLDDYFYEEECRGRLFEYYWKQEVFKLFGDIVRKSPDYKNYYMHLPYCWYIARKITTDSHLAEAPYEKRYYLTDRLNRYSAMHEKLKDMILLALALIELATIFKGHKSYASEKARERVAMPYLEKNITFPITNDGIMAYENCFIENDTVLDESINYLLRDEGAEEIWSRFRAECKEQASMQLQHKDDVKRIEQLEKSVAEKDKQIKDLQAQIIKYEASQKEENETAVIERKDKNGKTVTKTITAKEASIIAIKYNYKDGMEKEYMMKFLSEITGLKKESFKNYLIDN